jgi:hypothetical protein
MPLFEPAALQQSFANERVVGYKLFGLLAGASFEGDESARPVCERAAEVLLQVESVPVGNVLRTWSGSRTGPPFSTTRCVRLSLTTAVTRTQPPGWLWPRALSITFSTMRKSSVSLPATHASGPCCCSTSIPHCRDRVGAALDRLAGEFRERDRRLLGEWPVLGVGEGEEALQQPVDVVELAAEPVGQCADVWGQTEASAPVGRAAGRRCLPAP